MLNNILEAPQALITLIGKEISGNGRKPGKPISELKDGSRHVDLISYIGRFRSKSFSNNEILTMALALDATSDNPLGEVEVTKMVLEYAHQEKLAEGTEDSATRELHHLTDIGNAERMYSQQGHVFRYCYDRKMFLIWQGTHWRWDTTGEIMRIAHDVVRTIYNEAANEPDDDKRKLIVVWAKGSEYNSRLSAMLEQVKCMVSITVDQLDSDPWLLNCNNGTINLKTGRLQLWHPEDFITRKINLDFDITATSEVWLHFLDHIFESKTGLIAYVKRALGYSITGVQVEQAIFFCHGGGWNGKSTLLGAIREILAEYASEVDPTAFMVDRHRSGGGPNEAIASLYKVNLVTSTEIEDGQKLATSLLKRMTGGESLRCEHKFERGFNFKPQHKLWLCGNHEPEISDTTNSIWNRLHKIPFKVKISAEERIKGFDHVLASEHGQAILAWLVQGCLQWHGQGLGESLEVQEATQAYRESQDTLEEFLTETCIAEVDATIKVSELYKTYTEWSTKNADKYFLGKVNFNARISEKGFAKVPGAGNKKVWRGLRLVE